LNHASTQERVRGQNKKGKKLSYAIKEGGGKKRVDRRKQKMQGAKSR